MQRARAPFSCNPFPVRLRKLGDDAARLDYIFSERGVGYCMPDPGER